MFVGTFERTLDEAGRMVLPAAFRDAFNDVTGILTPFDDCLALWLEPDFAAWLDRLDDAIKNGDMPVGFDDQMLYDSREVRAKGQGRIQLPAELRTEAALDQVVVAAGSRNRIELWNPDRFRARRGESDQWVGEARRNLRAVK